MESLDAFVALVGPWMEQVQLPRHLWEVLYHKLKSDTFDSGSSFAIAEIAEEDEEEVEDEDHDASDNKNEQAASRSTPNKRVLVTTQDTTAESDVWLIDHA